MKTGRAVGILLIAVAAVLAPCVLLQAAPDAAVKPPAEMANLEWFAGNWTCEGKAEASVLGPGGKVSGTVKSHTDLGGFWQSGVVKSSMGTMAVEGMFHMTYNPAAKHYVLIFLDSMGAYGQETSMGWQGDKMVFSGPMAMGGQEMTVRDTFTKMSKSMRHDWEGQFDGNWVPMGTETCQRAAATGEKVTKK
jgi:hypothetical protein